MAPRQLSAVPISERPVLTEILLHLKKSLNFVDAGVLPGGEPRQKEGGGGHTKNTIDTSEPGSPAFEYRNV